MNHLIKPYYQVKFSSSSCSFEIQVNDIPAFIYHDTGMVSSQVPINHLILASGKQDISLRVFPAPGKISLDSYSNVKISVTCYESEYNDDKTFQLLEYETPEVKEAGLPFMKFRSEFEAKVPYQLNGWVSSINLKEQSSIEIEVYTYYKHVHHFLSRKDFKAFYDIYKNKLLEVDKAIYSTPEETENEWKELVGFLSDKNMKIAPFPADTELYFYGNGKVVSLLRSNFEPALYFENKEEKIEYQVPILLHKPKGSNKLEVIR